MAWSLARENYGEYGSAIGAVGGGILGNQ